MSDPRRPQTAAQKNAEHYFRSAEQQPDTLGKQTRKKERAADVKNTARLRDLRLAKEAADKEAADKLAAENPAATPAPSRKRGVSVRSVVRMTY
jgi:hypothetical protein